MPDDLALVIGANLRGLRARRGLSLERLARCSGVSRTMLGQVELGKSSPTINVLWKIARALGVTFSTLISSRIEGYVLLRAAEARYLSNQGGAFVSRALFPLGEPRQVEFYQLRLVAHGEEIAEPHPEGTIENLIVASGSVEIEVAGSRHQLGQGDAAYFEADVPHAYRNLADFHSTMYLVMTYPERIG